MVNNEKEITLTSKFIDEIRALGIEGMFPVAENLVDTVIDGVEQYKIKEIVARLETEYNATQYIRDRAAAYKKLNQDELRFDDLVNGTTTWQDTINAIKAEFPKPV